MKRALDRLSPIVHGHKQSQDRNCTILALLQDHPFIRAMQQHAPFSSRPVGPPVGVRHAMTSSKTRS